MMMLLHQDPAYCDVMIRLLLLDDHLVVRSGYRRLLDAEPGIQVVADTDHPDDAYACICEGGVDLAIIDLNLRDASGMDAIRRMTGRDRQLKVLVLSMHHQAGYVVQAMRAGALGYLTKSCSVDELVKAVHQVAQGQRFIGSDVAQELARTALDGEQVMDRLSVREFEILRLIAQGEPAHAIAVRLHLSQKTVLNNLSMIRQKLGVENDFQLLRLAIDHGLAPRDLG